MASLFAAIQPDKKRMVPNGGLGGFVLPLVEANCSETTGAVAESPLGKPKPRKRPPPIRIFCGGEKDSTWPSQASEGSNLGAGGLWTPNTPTDRLKLSFLVESDMTSRSAPWTSRYSAGVPRVPCCSPPETPISPLNSPPTELPGSLLLPSQGFPQTTPISPPPSLRVGRRDTEDSTLSSAPTLSSSFSSDADAMETLRNLTIPLRKHDRGSDHAMPPYVIGARATEDPAIKKPLSAMSLEELLDFLPQCSPTVVTSFWLPAVRAQIQRMMELLNDVGELKIESSLNQIALQKDLKSFTDEIRMVATSYHKVLESAESLVERDTKACHERLRDLENQVEEALEKMGAKDEEIAEQDRTNADLKHTVHDIVHILGSFIHDNVSTWVETINEPRTEEVLEIISDYSHYSDHENDPIPYVRVPESTIAQYMLDIREAKASAKEYRELLHEQSTLINEQSRNLDAYTNKYEIAARVIKERDHEIVLLVQKIESLNTRLEECEAALIQSQESIAEVESKAGRYEELRGNMESLKIAHTLELDQRDEEIAQLRQMLGSAREEVVARRADVKNIISQSQTGLAASEIASTTAKGGPASKALRFFGMDRDKERGRRPPLPSSQSMVGFTPSHHDATTHPLDTRYSSKEVAPTKSKSFLRTVSPLGRRRQAQTTPSTPVDGAESGTGSMASFPAVVRPRSDSLGATQRHGVLASPINTHKALPDPPVRSQPQLLSPGELAEITQDVVSPTAAQIATDYLQNSILGQTAARRVLSNIPEVSIHTPSHAGDVEGQVWEDEEASDESVASMDREVYRRSVCALDMLNSSTLPYSETATEVDRMLRGIPDIGPEEHDYRTHHGFDGGHHDDAEGWKPSTSPVLHFRRGHHDLRASRERERSIDRQERFRHSFVSDASSSGYPSEGSEPKTVAQLYHHGRRHIRG